MGGGFNFGIQSHVQIITTIANLSRYQVHIAPQNTDFQGTCCESWYPAI